MIQLLHSPISHDHFLSALVPASFVTAGRLSPGRYWIAPTGSLSFAATVRMIHRIHRHAANMRPNSFPTSTSRFTERNIFVFDIAHLTYGGATFDWYAPHFTGGHAQLRKLTFF